MQRLSLPPLDLDQHLREYGQFTFNYLISQARLLNANHIIEVRSPVPWSVLGMIYRDMCIPTHLRKMQVKQL
jgi:hypothetical protein